MTVYIFASADLELYCTAPATAQALGSHATSGFIHICNIPCVTIHFVILYEVIRFSVFNLLLHCIGSTAPFPRVVKPSGHG